MNRTLPKFANEAEEAQWHYENRAQDDAILDDAIREGTVRRGSPATRIAEARGEAPASGLSAEARKALLLATLNDTDLQDSVDAAEHGLHHAA